MGSTTKLSQTERREGYLFGHPITHSLSPLLHQTVYDALGLPWRQTLHDSLSIPSFLELTKTPEFYGASVTMPHKVAIIPHLSSLTPEATAIGAVNTVFIANPQDPVSERKLVGTNTDCIGVREALVQNLSPEVFKSFSEEGTAGAIVGGGGTSRAAVYALKNFVGVSKVYFLNRDPSEVEAVVKECLTAGFVKAEDLIFVTSLEHAKTLPKPRVIVSAIPDFEPKSEGELAVRAELEYFLSDAKGDEAILEMCYHPSPNTRISGLASSKGWNVIKGTEAMIWQGVEQDRYWTGLSAEELPVEKMKAVIKGAVEARAKELGH